VKKVIFHRCGGGIAMAMDEGIENLAMITYSLILSHEAVAMAEAGLQEIGQGLHEQGADFIAGGFGNETVELHVSKDLGLDVLTLFEAFMRGFDLFEIGSRGALGSKAGILGLKSKTNLRELKKTLFFIRHEHVDGTAEGLVKLVHDGHATALTNFQQALKFQAFRGFAHHAAADAKLSGHIALSR
jgi:hypothetical protein